MGWAEPGQKFPAYFHLSPKLLICLPTLLICLPTILIYLPTPDLEVGRVIHGLDREGLGMGWVWTDFEWAWNGFGWAWTDFSRSPARVIVSLRSNLIKSEKFYRILGVAFYPESNSSCNFYPELNPTGRFFVLNRIPNRFSSYGPLGRNGLAWTTG